MFGDFLNVIPKSMATLLYYPHLIIVTQWGYTQELRIRTH